jgi:hypothetical protein
MYKKIAWGHVRDLLRGFTNAFFSRRFVYALDFPFLQVETRQKCVAFSPRTRSLRARVSWNFQVVSRGREPGRMDGRSRGVPWRPCRFPIKQMPAGTRATPQAPASISSCSLGVRQRISLSLSFSFPRPRSTGGLRASHVSCGMRNPSWIHHVCVSLGLHLLTKVNQQRYISLVGRAKGRGAIVSGLDVRRVGILQRDSAMQNRRVRRFPLIIPRIGDACVPNQQ